MEINQVSMLCENRIQLKLSCDSRFQRAFTACSCVFKLITLVWANQRNFFENATTCSKRMRKTLVATQGYIQDIWRQCVPFLIAYLDWLVKVKTRFFLCNAIQCLWMKLIFWYYWNWENYKKNLNDL